jgi:hypothetical protein
LFSKCDILVRARFPIVATRCDSIQLRPFPPSLTNMPVQPLPNGRFRAYDRDFADAASAAQYQAARDGGLPVDHPSIDPPAIVRAPSTWWLLLLLPLALGIYFLALGFALPISEDPKSAERDAIKFCWKDQARKSLTPAEQRFVAKTCEQREADFRQAYRVEP